MAYSMAIRKKIEKFLTDDDWKYRFDEEREVIKFGINVDCKLRHVNVVIDLRENGFYVYSTIDAGADQKCIASVAEFLHRANYGLRVGNFELDFRDGEIRYKVYVQCDDDGAHLVTSMVQRSILVPISMMQKYGDGLLAVMYGFKTPEEAVKESESDD